MVAETMKNRVIVGSGAAQAADGRKQYGRSRTHVPRSAKRLSDADKLAECQAANEHLIRERAQMRDALIELRPLVKEQAAALAAANAKMGELEAAAAKQAEDFTTRLAAKNDELTAAYCTIAGLRDALAAEEAKREAVRRETDERLAAERAAHAVTGQQVEDNAAALEAEATGLAHTQQRLATTERTVTSAVNEAQHLAAWVHALETTQAETEESLDIAHTDLTRLRERLSAAAQRAAQLQRTALRFKGKAQQHAAGNAQLAAGLAAARTTINDLQHQLAAAEDQSFVDIEKLAQEQQQQTELNRRLTRQLQRTKAKLAATRWMACCHKLASSSAAAGLRHRLTTEQSKAAAAEATCRGLVFRLAKADAEKAVLTQCLAELSKPSSLPLAAAGSTLCSWGRSGDSSSPHNASSGSSSSSSIDGGDGDAQRESEDGDGDVFVDAVEEFADDDDDETVAEVVVTVLLGPPAGAKAAAAGVGGGGAADGGDDDCGRCADA